jgi:formate dehydrogenase major subunit
VSASVATPSWPGINRTAREIPQVCYHPPAGSRTNCFLRHRRITLQTFFDRFPAGSNHGTYCGVGCSFEIWTKDRHILKVEPSEGPANGVSTCVKGKFGWDFVNSRDRLTKPLIREGETFREATWDEALNLVATRLSEIKRAHGPDAIGLIASSKCTNEEAYLMQKLARAVIGTNNVDNCSRYCQSPATMGLFRTVGHGGDTGSIKDLERAGLVVIIGSNTAESHPVIATRIKRAHKLHGQKLIVSDLRRNEMAERVDIHPEAPAGYGFGMVRGSKSLHPG